jgi:colanic acid/amylovoran biosynthesis glycosyltransferase
MKIAYFLPAENVLSETFIADLVAGLSQSGAQVQLAPDKSPNPKTALNFEQRPLFDRLLARLANASAGRWHYIDRYRCSVAARRRVDRFLHKTAPDVAYVDYATQAMLLAPILQQAGVPLVVHVHGFDVTATMGNAFFVKQLEGFFASAHAFIVPSQHLRRRLLLAGCEPAKLHVVHYEPHLEGWQALPMAERTAAPSVVALGRLTSKKSPFALLRAFALVHAQLPAARLTLIGTGPLAGQVRQLVHELKLESAVELTGALPRKEALARVRQHWLFAQHSVTAANGDQEGLPVAIIEACALGMPVVSTRHSGIPEEVIDGETGFLVAEHDYQAMAERMLELLRDPAKCTAMGQRGQQHIQQLCPPGQHVKTILQHLRQVAAL